MSEVTLEFSSASTEADLWAEIKRGICPEFDGVGANLDALIDVLRNNAADAENCGEGQGRGRGGRSMGNL